MGDILKHTATTTDNGTREHKQKDPKAARFRGKAETDNALPMDNGDISNMSALSGGTAVARDEPWTRRSLRQEASDHGDFSSQCGCSLRAK